MLRLGLLKTRTKGPKMGRFIIHRFIRANTFIAQISYAALFNAL